MSLLHINALGIYASIPRCGDRRINLDNKATRQCDAHAATGEDWSSVLPVDCWGMFCTLWQSIIKFIIDLVCPESFGWTGDGFRIILLYLCNEFSTWFITKRVIFTAILRHVPVTLTLRILSAKKWRARENYVSIFSNRYTRDFSWILYYFLVSLWYLWYKFWSHFQRCSIISWQCQGVNHTSYTDRTRNWKCITVTKLLGTLTHITIPNNGRFWYCL